MPAVLTSEQRLYGATANGAELLAFPPAFGSASRALDHVAPGVYEGLRTFDRTRFFGLRSHLERLQVSIDGYKHPLAYDEEVLIRALEAAAADACAVFGSEARVRVDVSAEPAERFGSDANILLALTPFRGLPPEIVSSGAYLGVVPGLRRPDPAVKTSDFIPLREAWITAHGDAAAYEHLMLGPDGEVLEGTQSNVVLVRDGALWSAPGGVLPGVTLRAVLSLARDAGVEVHESFTNISDVPSFDEAFMTTSVRSIVPLSRIGDARFDAPGPITKRLSDLYDTLTASDAVEPEKRADARY